MSRYTYEAIDVAGNPVSGEIAAMSVSKAIQELEKQGLELRSIQLLAEEQLQTKEELAQFHRRVEELLVAKNNWLPALTAMAEELPTGGVRKEIQRLVIRLGATTSVDKFLASYDASTLLPVLTAGLDTELGTRRLHHWIDTVSKQIENRLRRQRAIIYPATLICLVFFVFIMFSLYLLPIFKSLFQEFGIRLPTPTRLAILLSDQIAIHYHRTTLALLFFSSVTYVIVRHWRRRAMTNRIFGKFVAGSTSNLIAMSTYASTLAELLSLGAPVPLALQIAGRSSHHQYYQYASEQLALYSLKGNAGDSLPPVAYRLPPLILHSLFRGQDGRPNVQLLREIARIYSDRTALRLNVAAESLPALATFCVAVLVAVTVIMLFLPLVSMVSSLS
jgi:type II secretory pathway component PulF